ncbi:MAG TPA: peptidoglycan DD-metalloendopeptidase family protein [Actinomycetota bacterium]|nr:peptidoglycan DD-metalloendopeptidase family protein [Actinomycetota bacterium]
MRWRATITIACVLAILAPAGPVARAHDSDDIARLKRIRARLERTRDALAEANQERRGVLVDLAASDARRNQLTGRIDDLTSQLASAKRRLNVLRTRLDQTRLELLRWTRRLEDTRRDLRVQETTLDNRAATAYKIGPGGYLDLILGAGDLRSLIDRAEFLEKVLHADTDLLLDIQTAKGMLAENETRVREYEQRVTGQWNEVKAEADRIERLRAQQLALRAEVDEEIAIREGLLGDIEQQRKKYIAAVRQLEAESAAIEDSLRSGGSRGSGRGHGQLFWPADGPITSGFGWRVHPIFGTRRFHSGVDIDAGCGTPIWAAESGRVISAGWMGGYGLATVIDHGNGLATLYAHQSAIRVSSGQSVRRAQLIGSVGTTGWSTGCHLHFEVRINGEPVDPVPYLT